MTKTHTIKTHAELIKGYYQHSGDEAYPDWVEKLWLDISPINEYAEGPLVELHLIPTFFESLCHIVYCSNDSKPLTTHSNHKTGENLQYVTAIYIILSGEHYNILYARASSSYISSDQQHEGELEPVNCNYPINT